jgi:hypothetical protein
MRSIASFIILVMTVTNGYAQHLDSVPVHLKKSPWFVERFRVTTGVFIPVVNTDLQVGINGGDPGTPVNLEKDLGFNSSELTFIARFQWRIARRSLLGLTYYNIPQSSTQTLNDDLIFKEDTFHVNNSVNVYFNTKIYQISYGYSILSKPKYEMGIRIGMHLVGAKTGISQKETNGNNSKSNDFGITAPLPDLGIWGGYMFSKHFAMNLDFAYLSLTVGNKTGRLLNYNLGFIYRMVKKLDLSLGYSGLNFKLDAVKENSKANFKWGYNGPYLGLTYSFGKNSWEH